MSSTYLLVVIELVRYCLQVIERPEAILVHKLLRCHRTDATNLSQRKREREIRE